MDTPGSSKTEKSADTFEMCGSNDSQRASVLETGTRTELTSSDNDHVILSVCWRKGKLGAAAYYSQSSEIQILSDIVDVRPDFKILRTLFLQLQPTKVLMTSTLLECFVQTVKSLVTGTDIPTNEETESDSSVPLKQILTFLPSKEYKYENARRRVQCLKLASEPEHMTEEMRSKYIATLVNLTAESLVSALGGLLQFLDRTLPRMNLSTRQSSILALLQLSFDNLVWVDEETIRALQIFAPVQHPTTFRHYVKEGVSIFSLFKRCESRIGNNHMRVMLSQPTRDISILTARHEVIQFCLQSTNEPVVNAMISCIKLVKSVTAIMTRITNSQGTVVQWKQFYTTVCNAVLIAQLCEANSSDVRFFKKIGDAVDERLFTIVHVIERCVDFEESGTRCKLVIKTGVSDELDKLHESRNILPNVLSRSAELELAQLPSYINTCAMVYIPEIGYLTAIALWQPDLEEEQLQLPGLEFKFKVNDTAHYKSALCLEMDQVLGDSQLKIMRIESSIMIRVAEYIRTNINPIITLTNFIAELDCLIAMSRVARDNDYMCPKLVEEQVLDIKQGRHPLQELTVDTFVPNDTVSSQETTVVKIITGPNSSGKSVYLKQVALIAYLAHIGSYVPAKSATIGLLHHIHTRIQCVESAAADLSAFMIDIKQVSLSLYNSSPTSLVVIDEFGKGTCSMDGLAILASCVRHFLARSKDCPHLLVSTHFHSLKDYLPASALYELQTFSYMTVNDQIVCLYHLKSGSASSSLAIEVAIANGMPQSTADRAAEVADALRNGKTIRPIPELKTTQQMIRRQSFLDKFYYKKFENEEDLEWLKKELSSLKADTS